MPNPDVWPPKPNLPDPLTEYDALINEQMVELPGEPLALRFFNILKVLRKEKGLDWLSGLAAVQSYHRRHGSAPDAKRLVVLAFTALALAFPACLLQLYNVYLMFHRDVVLSQPNHQAALRILDQERHIIGSAVGILLGLSYLYLTVIYGPTLYQRLRKK